MSQPPPSDEATLRELALRLAYPLPRGMAHVHDQQLFVGTLPPPLDTLLPVPEYAIILGGVRSVTVHADAEDVIEQPQYTAFLDIPSTVQSALEFFRGQFTARGWIEQPLIGQQRGGFMLAVTNYTCLFAHPEHESVQLSLVGSTDLAMQVRVQNEPLTRKPLERQGYPRVYKPDLLPPLVPPAGARHISGAVEGVPITCIPTPISSPNLT